MDKIVKFNEGERVLFVYIVKDVNGNDVEKTEEVTIRKEWSEDLYCIYPDYCEEPNHNQWYRGRLYGSRCLRKLKPGQ